MGGGDPTFHAGELALWQRAGSLPLLTEAGPRVIRDYMPQQHRDFFAQLIFLLVGSVGLRQGRSAVRSRTR